MVGERFVHVTAFDAAAANSGTTSGAAQTRRSPGKTDDDESLPGGMGDGSVLGLGSEWGLMCSGVAAAIFLLLFVGGPMAVAGDLSVGDLAAYATLIGALLPPLKSLGWMLSVLQRGRAALERIFELIDAVVDRPEGEHPVVQEGGKGPSIEVRELNFASGFMS